jgi:Holliday junction resolvase RusA-like endonuclease
MTLDVNGRCETTLVILGEPASKANSRRIVNIRGRMVPIKSQKALDYVTFLRSQAAAQMSAMIEGDLRVEMMIHYASRRPDLDESVILDALQGIAYANDRQVKQRMTYWGLDKDMPSAVIRITQCDLDDVPEYLRTTSTGIA